MAVSNTTSDVTIVGGGIIGAALAWELASAGVSTEIVERREIGREASWASAGIISPPGPRHGTRADLAVMAFKRYPSLIAEVEELAGLSVGYVPHGEVELGDDARVADMRDVMAWQQEHGVRVEWLDAAALREREPAVDARFTSALFIPDAGSVVLSRMTQALALAAGRRGARVRQHELVVGLTIERGRVTTLHTVNGSSPVGTLVIAAGAWSRVFGDMLDLTIPTVPVRGQMLAIAEPPLPLRAVIAGPGGYLVPRADGTIAVGATEEHDAGFDTTVTPAGLAWLAQLAASIAPSLVHGRFVDAWAGLRPGSVDDELIVGRHPQLDNVWISTGHFRSGALLAPASAELLAASIRAGATDARLRAFDPGRFSGANP